MTNLTQLFTANTTEAAKSSTRSLSGTAELTAIANRCTTLALGKINGDLDKYRDAFVASKTSGAAMDALCSELVQFEALHAELDFIKQLDSDTVDGILKSQQSKRSRAKGKPMTLDNYTSMMNGAFAENLLRFATGKKKVAGGVRRAAGVVGYNDEELKALEADQQKLKKEIRNVQSKKSIMKAKPDFDEASERWVELCKAEESLKAIRVAGPTERVVVVDETKSKLEEMLTDIDPTHLAAKDSKQLLAMIKSMIE